MSTEPGKSKGRSGGTGKGSGSSTGSSGKKAVPAAKPGRDEATVEISPVKPALDETTPDLGKPGDAKPKDAEQTAVDNKIVGRDEPASKDPVEASAPKPADGPASKPGPPIPPVKDTPAESGSNWNRPPDGKPFGRREVAGGGTAPAAGSGFAGTALKDRPAPASARDGAKPAAGAKSARKAQLQLARLEPWSVMKFSFVMSLVCFVVLIVAVVVLYVILSGLGVFDAISGTVDELTRDPRQTEGGLDAANWFSFVRVFGYTVLVGALNVLLITALSTVGAVIYNLAADLVGGVEVTLKEAE